MKYDTVKDKFAFIINLFPGLRKVFYKGLNCLILRQQYVLDLITKMFPDKDTSFKMYDAGGGYLQYSDFVLTKYPKAEVFAVDIKEDYIDDYYSYIRGSTKEERFTYKCADLQYYQPQTKFDLIIAIDIMEHIENDQAVLNHFSEALATGGKLLISTPSIFDEAAAFAEEHVRPGYDLEELIKKIEKANLKVTMRQYTYGKYGALYWKIALKKPLQLLNSYKVFYLLLPFYYLLTYPVIKILMMKDKRTDNKIGNGIIVIAEKMEKRWK